MTFILTSMQCKFTCFLAVSPEADSFFLASVSNPFDPATTDTIHRVSTDFTNSTELGLGTVVGASHVNYDPMYGLVYWADNQGETINRGYADNRYNNTDPCFSEIVLTDIRSKYM